MIHRRIVSVIVALLVFVSPVAECSEPNSADSEWHERLEVPIVNLPPTSSYDLDGTPTITIMTAPFSLELQTMDDYRAIGETPGIGFVLALWSSGKVIFSENESKMGSPYSIANVGALKVTEIISYMESAGLFRNGDLNEIKGGPGFILHARNAENKYLRLSVNRTADNSKTISGKDREIFADIYSRIVDTAKVHPSKLAIGEAPVPSLKEVSLIFIDATMEKYPSAKLRFPGKSRAD